MVEEEDESLETKSGAGGVEEEADEVISGLLGTVCDLCVEFELNQDQRESFGLDQVFIGDLKDLESKMSA